MTTPQSAVVIGAGVAGLATATLLAKTGVDVTVIDSRDEAGGRAGNLTVDGAPGFRWDTGPSWYLMPEAFDHFFQLCGTSTDAVMNLVDLSPAYRIYPESPDYIDVDSGVDHVAALFDGIEPGAGAKVRDYLRDSTDAYRMSIDHFLYTTFADPKKLAHGDIRARLGRLVKLLTGNLNDLVAGDFDDARLRQILTYPAVFLSTQPTQAPALYSLMSHTDLVEGVRYPQGGFAALVAAIEQLAVDAGVKFRFGTQATAIETTETRPHGRSRRIIPRGIFPGRRPLAAATGVRVCAADSAAGSTETIHADIVVSAADLHHTETSLLPPALRTYPETYWSQRDPGLGTVLLFLGVRGQLPQLAHHTLMFSHDWDPDFRAVYEGPEPTRPLDASRSIYISRTSATDDDAAPAGHENLFVLVPVPADESIGHGDAYGQTQSARVAAIADATIDQIAAWAGIADLRDRIVVQRTLGPADFADRYHAWSGGSIGPAHTLRQSAFLRGANQSAKVDGLYYAGATTVPGVGVPMCLISAENVIKRIHGDTSSGPLDHLP